MPIMGGMVEAEGPSGTGGAAELLSRVRVVLVEPRGPRNVGSVARAMTNFGLFDLRLVGGPRLDHPECLEMAVKAAGVLRAAARHDALQEALAGATFVVGTTAKRRHRTPALRPRDAAEAVVKEAGRGPVALLFGREDHGLDARELRCAHVTVAIETSPACRALNLSHAVALLAYEIFQAAGAHGVVASSGGGRLLTADMRRLLEDELCACLRSLGILHDGNAAACEQTIERLLALGPMQTRDARLLFALARRVQALFSEADR